MTSMEEKNLVYCPSLDAKYKNSSLHFEPLFSNKNEKSNGDVMNDSQAVEESNSENKKEKQLGMFEFRTKIVWFNAIGFLILHSIALYGTYLVTKDAINGHFAGLLWMLFVGFISAEGVTIGAHRLWTHRSFKAKLPLQIILIILQTLAGQNCCYIWVRDHRQHHKYSDTDADPHNASRGFFFSHVGWLMMKKHPEVIKKGKGIDLSDLEANPVVMFQKKYYKTMYFLIGIVFPVVLPMYLWNEEFWKSLLIHYFARYLLVLNGTWCVNSVAHIWGTKPYDKNILPVESVFVSFISSGEGWHNYHHVFPWDYKASEFGMNLNGSRIIIEFFAKIGWAYDLREASEDVVKNRIKRSGDGTHPISCENWKCVGRVCDTEEESLIEPDSLEENQNLLSASKTTSKNKLHDTINETKPSSEEIVRNRSHGSIK